MGSRAGARLASPTGLSALANEEGFREHVAELSKSAAESDWGVIGEDLCELLVDVAMGSPAICALRALRRIAPDLAWDDPRLLVESDLVPYWIYEGPIKVERRVPMLPYSREVTRLAWLKRSLTVYRLAFGQPRQDDLLEYLQSLTGDGAPVENLDDLQIRLEPPDRDAVTPSR